MSNPVTQLAHPPEYMKAIFGALAAGLTAAGTALIADGISPAEYVGIASAVVLTFGAVFQTTNKTAS